MKFEKFEDAIVEINGVISPQFLQLLEDYAEKKCTKRLATSSGDTNMRKVLGHPLTTSTVSDIAYFKNIQDEIMKGYNHYKFKFPQTTTSKVLQTDLLKYEEGYKYDYHTDHDTVEVQSRTLSIILNLNDEYEGGDLVFGHQNLRDELKRIKMKSGTMCLFPSNFLYPHKIEKITKGTRYSVITWLG